MSDKCPICGKTFKYWEEKPFEIYSKKYHLDCLPQAIRHERALSARRQAEREQKKITNWHQIDD